MNYFIETIKSTRIGFKLWYHLYRKPRISKKNRHFFNEKTKLFITGFPRSGNTYAAFLIDNVFDKLNYVHHFHSVGPVKIALQNKVPVFVLVRDPLNSITSYYLKLLSYDKKEFTGNVDMKLLQSTAEFFVFYHKGILKLSNKIEIVSFQDLIKSPVSTLAKVNERVNFGHTEEDLIALFEKASQKQFGAKDTLGSSLPNETKEQYKKTLQESLLNLPIYKECELLYNQLMNQN